MEQIGKENEMKEKTSELDLRLQKMESTIAKLTLVEQQISVTHREANHCIERLNGAIADTKKTITLCQDFVVYMKENVVVNSKVDTADIEKIKGLCKNIIQEEQKLLEKHAKARCIEIQKHKEDIHSLFDKGGVLVVFFLDEGLNYIHCRIYENNNSLCSTSIDI